MVASIIVAVILVAILSGIIVYLRREKKKGVTCIGCPYAAQCAKQKSGGCGKGRT